MFLCVSVTGHLKHLFVQQAPRSSATVRSLVDMKARAWISSIFLCRAPRVLVMSRFTCVVGVWTRRS